MPTLKKKVVLIIKWFRLNNTSGHKGTNFPTKRGPDKTKHSFTLSPLSGSAVLGSGKTHNMKLYTDSLTLPNTPGLENVKAKNKVRMKHYCFLSRGKNQNHFCKEQHKIDYKVKFKTKHKKTNKVAGCVSSIQVSFYYAPEY